MHLWFMQDILIYGAYGYTSRLIVDECLRHGLSITLSGRSEAPLKKLAEEKNLPFVAIDLADADKLKNELKKSAIVIHCAGPFSHTAKQMVEACISSGTHYLDITGEYQVFDLVQSYDKQAQEKNIMLLPGAGFDVVPSDCLAQHLKNKLPDATELQLSFTSMRGGLSRGTAKTMAENAGQKTTIRRNGKYEFVGLGKLTRIIDYGPVTQPSLAISWGDISSAYFSTGIPNITVYLGSNPSQIRKMRLLNSFRFLLRTGWMKKFLKKQIDKRPPGPSERSLKEGKTYLWGLATQGGNSVEARLETPNGYALTAQSAAHIARKIIQGQFKPGYQTPSTAYGAGLISELDGCKMN
jgi:short subunit dehydrogenase-like uncharacterized protein